jgi:hypothetical protein
MPLFPSTAVFPRPNQPASAAQPFYHRRPSYQLKTSLNNTHVNNLLTARRNGITFTISKFQFWCSKKLFPLFFQYSHLTAQHFTQTQICIVHFQPENSDFWFRNGQ